MNLPSYKDIIELVKTGATIDAQERIMALRQAALELQEENPAVSSACRFIGAGGKLATPRICHILAVSDGRVAVVGVVNLETRF
jgi:hypothetical protein